MFLVSFERLMNNAIDKIFSIQFHACALKLQVFKKLMIFFGHFLGNVTIYVNGKVAFSKFPKNLNGCIYKVQCWNFTK